MSTLVNALFSFSTIFLSARFVRWQRRSWRFFGSVGGVVKIIEGQTAALRFGEDLLKLKIDALGVEDGLSNVGEDPGLAFGDVAVGSPEKDGVEDIADTFGGVEVLRHFLEQVEESLGAVLWKMVFAVGLCEGGGKIAAAATVARDVRAALASRRGRSQRLLWMRGR